MILLAAAALSLEFRQIRSSLPYPQHVDEGFVSGPANRTVTTGTFHPYTFNYPSLPKYLAAAGMAAGFVRGAARTEISDVQRIGSVGYPYYDTPVVMQTARQLFAVLSIVALAATGVCARLAFRSPATILLAPLVLITSPLFFFHSWAYLNVDIVGTCFVTLTIAAVLYSTTQPPSCLRSAVVPGLLAGLSTGSKYTLALVILSVLAGIALYPPAGRRARAALLALMCMSLAFLVVVPYSVLDLPGFLNGIAAEAFHYASGHRGHSGAPGFSQLLYYVRHFASEFGAGAAVAIIGIGAFSRADWRRAIVLIAYPVGLLSLLASERVQFSRNVLSLHPIVALFAALGLVVVHDWLIRLAVRRQWIRRPIRPQVLTAVAVVLVAAVVPWWHWRDAVRDRTDSRTLATEWIEQRLPAEWTIVVPRQLGLDARSLVAHGRRVKIVDLQSVRDTDGIQALVGSVTSPAVILVPRWGVDARYGNEETAGALNQLDGRWRVVQTFGVNDVLVNYSFPTPWGNPAFSIALLK